MLLGWFVIHLVVIVTSLVCLSMAVLVVICLASMDIPSVGYLVVWLRADIWRERQRGPRRWGCKGDKQNARSRECSTMSCLRQKGNYICNIQGHRCYSNCRNDDLLEEGTNGLSQLKRIVKSEIITWLNSSHGKLQTVHALILSVYSRPQRLMNIRLQRKHLIVFPHILINMFPTWP